VGALFDLLGGLLSARWIRAFFRKRAEGSEKPWRSKAKVQRRLVVANDLNATEARCRQLLLLMGTERAPIEAATRVIEVVTPYNWKSSGTVVRVQLAANPNGTNVSLSAWPGAQLFDWGESRRIVRRLASDLAALD
jgi:hypothetical protein